MFFTTAKVGLGFTFSTDADGVTIAHNANLNVQSTGFSVDFWMRGIKNQPQDQALVVDKSHGWTDSTGWLFQINSSTGTIYFAIGAGGAGSTNFFGVTSAGDVLDGNFHHIAGTWNGGAVVLYVDGVLQGSAPLSTPANNTRDVHMGFSWGGGTPNRFFRGTVDEVQIYNRALSTGEIEGIFSAGSVGVCRATYYFSQLALGGGWQTTLTYVNYSPEAVTCVTNFFTDSGAPLLVPFGVGTVSSRTDTLHWAILSRREQGRSECAGRPGLGAGYV
ncbi:MAG TPA: LamG domain-containing protein [Bryobacteraceae bacterium]|nr:LamG domain-containing protein [Bryobacteraceae bacterium]